VGSNTALDKTGLPVSKRPPSTGAPLAETAAGACLEESLCASTDSGTLSNAAKNTIVDGALHMNFPLLEQAQVCNLELHTAIVRMTQNQFMARLSWKNQNKKLHLGSFKLTCM
jgi:hypothetical protein